MTTTPQANDTVNSESNSHEEGEKIHASVLSHHSPEENGQSDVENQIRRQQEENGQSGAENATRQLDEQSLAPSDKCSFTPASFVDSGKEENKKENKKSRCPDLNKDAVIFACRLCFALTVSSLFVLLPPLDGSGYPQGGTVYVTATIVSWFPSLGSANVIQKNFQRILGTIVGAGLGLSLGFVCVAAAKDATQLAWSIGACVFCVSFLWSFFSIQFKINAKYAYPCMLGLFTFGIALLPFYTNENPKWTGGVYRVLNVVVGCFIGAAGALVIFPRSTKAILQDKVILQITKAGESSCAILHAATEILGGDKKAPTLEQLLEDTRHDDGPSYELHDTYISAIEDWKKTRELFPLLKWDPFMAFEERTRFQHEAAITLARAFRIQTTIVLMDSILRHGKEALQFDSEVLNIFYETGTLIKELLTVPHEEIKKGESFQRNDSEVAEERLLVQLERLAELVVGDCKHLTTEDYAEEDLFDGSITRTAFRRKLKNSMAIAVHESSKASSVLFLQLVEHLILRALRLYHAWHDTGVLAVFDSRFNLHKG